MIRDSSARDLILTRSSASFERIYNMILAPKWQDGKFENHNSKHDAKLRGQMQMIALLLAVAISNQYASVDDPDNEH
jgi:hypothetical protein